MKKSIILAFLIGSAFLVSAQMTLSSGSQIVVASGSTLMVNAVVNTSGTIDNDGTVSIKGNVTNNSGGLFASTSGGTVTFAGTSAQEITGAATVHFYGTLNINNSTGVGITGAAQQEVHGALSFTSGKLTLNNFNLTLDGTADPTGVGATSYLVTNGTGQLKRTVAANDILFPVGNTAYNPVTLNNAGDSDTYGVIAVDSKPTSFTGTEHIVNRSWDVTEATPGGSNYSVVAQWNVGEEATGFDRTKSCIGITADAGANVTWGPIGAALGSNPSYTQSNSGYTSVGTFMVGDYYYGGLVIDLKVVLAAAWNDANNNMDITLNTASLIPLTDPYGVGATVTAVPANAVDWVKVELRASGNHATVTNTYAKFVKDNGQVVEEDGTNMKLTGAAAGSYFVAVHHRNHFGVVSASTVEIESSPAINFTTAQATAWDDVGVTTNDAMKEVESGTFGMWEGDANDDGQVQYEGASPDRVTVLNRVGVSTPVNIVNGYEDSDVNMDGAVQYEGANPDRVTILNVVGVSTPVKILSEHIPQ